MKQNRIFALLLALVFLLALTGCGASGFSNGAVPGEAQTAADAMEAGEADYDHSSASGSALTGGGTGLRTADAKLIYTGELNMECTDLDAAMSAIAAQVEEFGGWFESQEIYRNSYNQSAYYTIRVPGDAYPAFLSAVGDNEACKVTYQNTTVDDVGEAYADLENRLETLQTKLDRLQELLSKAESMEDIITIESAISEVEYEIENLSGQKNHYDSLINYSTVNIYLSQVNTLSEGVSPTLGERLSSGFTGGLSRFADACANFLVWLVSNLIGVLIFLAVVAAILIISLRIRRKRKNAHIPPDRPEDSGGSQYQQ